MKQLYFPSIALWLLVAIPLVFFPEFLNAQDAQLVRVIPSSPTSASFERYTDYPVNLFNGVPDINIDLYEIISGDLRLPISLSYHASGIKMTDSSYPIGLGWTLRGAGGRISRTVRGRPDGQYPSLGTLPLTASPETVDGAMKYSHDSEPDIFFYDIGVGGGSGRFLFDGVRIFQNNSFEFADPIFFPHNNFKFSSSSLYHMTLTNEEGQTFKFGGTETEMGMVTAVEPAYVSSWLLYEILPTSKEESDKITIDYSPGPQLSTCTYEGSLTIIDSVSFEGGNDMDPYHHHFDLLYGISDPLSSRFRRIDDDGNKHTYVSNLSEGSGGNYTWFYNQSCHTYNTTNINSIHFKGGYVEFIYDAAGKLLKEMRVYDSRNEIIRVVEFHHSLYTGHWQHYKLDKLVIRGNDLNDAPKEYRFEYEMGVVESNYSARDHWNYFNGASYNTTPIPRWTDVRTLALSRYSNGLPDHLYMNTDIGTAERGTNIEFMKKYSLKRIYYPSGGYSDFEFEANKYYSPEEELLKDVGGLRVVKITSHDGMGNTLTKQYSYGENNSGVGVPRNVPTYEDYVVERHLKYDHLYQFCGSNSALCAPLALNPIYARHRDFLSSPNKEINYTDGSSVWYPCVEEFTTDGYGNSIGKTRYEYEFPSANDELNYYTDHGPLNTKYTIYFKGFNQPRLKTKTLYKSIGNDYVPVQKTEIDYSCISYGPYTAYTYPYYKWLTYNEGMDIRCDNVRCDDPFYHPHPGEILLTNGEIRSETYKVIKETVTDYPEDGSELHGVKTIKDYSYTPDSHLFPTRIETRDSGNKLQIESFKFPPDYKSLTGQDDLTKGIKRLQDDNLVSLPVESVVELAGANYENPHVVSARFTSFKSTQPFVDRVYVAELYPAISFSKSTVAQGSVVIDPSYRERFQVDLYNAQGDILQQHLKDNAHETYIWGYENMYPVAKIVGTDYNTAFNILTTDQKNALINPSGDQQVRDIIQAIRNHPSMSNAMVYTYTYDPLVGMTSIVDENNRLSTFEYDGLGRLKLVRDFNNDIVKMYDYNYQVR